MILTITEKKVRTARLGVTKLRVRSTRVKIIRISTNFSARR